MYYSATWLKKPRLEFGLFPSSENQQMLFPIFLQVASAIKGKVDLWERTCVALLCLSELDKDVQCSYDVASQAIVRWIHSHSTIEIEEKNKTRFWNISFRELADAVSYFFAENCIRCQMKHRSLGDRGEQWSFFGSDGMVIFFCKNHWHQWFFLGSFNHWFQWYSMVIHG